MTDYGPLSASSGRTLGFCVAVLLCLARGRVEAQACCSKDVITRGLEIGAQYKVTAIAERRFTHEQLWGAIEPSLRSPDLATREIGQSNQGRAIRAITFGRGKTSVLLWSQMHGDESTATMSLADIFRFLAEAKDDPLRQRLASSLTITFIPMLNPDGAQLFQRENAQGIDVNRDARRLSTPEARALKGVHTALKPDFAFNLHDQSARARVGPGGPQAAIALLAPATDSARGYNAVRSRGRLVASTIAQVLAHEIPGRVAKYDDTFNPRAFGDLIQQWGSSTVLIESGALADDPQKQRLRQLNVAAILGALDAIATGSYAKAGPEAYDKLPFNASSANDILLLGGQVVVPGRAPYRADIAIAFEDAVALKGPRIREVGDLDGAIALDTIDVAGLFLHPDPSILTTQGGQTWLRLGARARIDIRRGVEGGSPLVTQMATDGPHDGH